MVRTLAYNALVVTKGSLQDIITLLDIKICSPDIQSNKYNNSVLLPIRGSLMYGMHMCLYV